jgi:hypothetical protein
MADASGPGLLDLLTLGIALWGAGLSSALGLREVWSDKRRLKVRCNEAVAALPDGTTADFIIVSVVNVGKRLVEVKSAGLSMSDRLQFTQPVSRTGMNPFGRKLADGESADFMFDRDAVEHAANDPKRSGKFVRAFARDAEGRVYSVGLGRGLKRQLNRRTDVGTD